MFLGIVLVGMAILFLIVVIKMEVRDETSDLRKNYGIMDEWTRKSNMYLLFFIFQTRSFQECPLLNNPRVLGMSTKFDVITISINNKMTNYFTD